MLRRIALPEGATEEDATASYKDGIMKVRAPMPRAESAQEPAKVSITRG
ncbi:Hsp20/alpha crystallin family protein [Arthrobacter alpinus]|nr:Hsp20/alpha crystallin family protein [Arthrobacter alpinus]